jgi:uncharacterized protein YjiS (DUF1127 family)
MSAIDTTHRTARSDSPVLRHASTLLLSWLRHRRQRRELVQLSDSMLHDLGLTRADVEREHQRPFWQPADHPALEGARRARSPLVLWRLG